MSPDPEGVALRAVEVAARRYASFTHANIGGRSRHIYLAREEARERLRDALARLDVVRARRAA